MERKLKTGVISKLVFASWFGRSCGSLEREINFSMHIKINKYESFDETIEFAQNK